MHDNRDMFVSEEEEKRDDAWDRVFLAHAALGCDYHRAKKRSKTSQNKWVAMKETKPCEYDAHPWAEACEAANTGMYDTTCEYVKDDCYPVWKVQEANHVGLEHCVEAVTQSESENGIPDTIGEPGPLAEIEPESQTDMPDNDVLTAGAKITEDTYRVVIQEEEKPPMALGTMKAEMARMSVAHQKKFKTGMKNGLMLEVTEEQPDDWVYTQ